MNKKPRFSSPVTNGIVALLSGFIAMFALYLIVANLEPSGRTGQSVPSEISVPVQFEGSLKVITLEKQPAPFVDGEGNVLGYVFLNVTVYVNGAEAEEAFLSNMDAINTILATELQLGAAYQQENEDPGIYGQLARQVTDAVNQLLGPGAVETITIEESASSQSGSDLE